MSIEALSQHADEQQLVVLNEVRHDSGATIREVEVLDKYLKSPEDFAATTEYIAMLEKHAATQDEKEDLKPLFYNQERPAMCEWYNFMGKAIALYNLQRPDTTTLGDGLVNPYHTMAQRGSSSEQRRAERYIPKFDEYAATPVDRESENLFRYSADGRGIRSRALVFKDAVVKKAERNGMNLDMLSVACGAALPIYDAANGVREYGGDPSLALIDIDLSALDYASQLAEREGLSDSVDIKQVDLKKVLLNEIDLTKQLGHDGETRTFDTVDLLGIFEYFPGEYAAELLKKVKELTSENGSIIFGNMLNNRQQMTFFDRYVGWRPQVKPRSVDELLGIVSEAGFELEDVTVSIPEDGVYAVIEIANVNSTNMNTNAAS